jgi:hypothetical protein
VSGVDWENVIEEIACVGRTELNDLCSYLRRMLVHLLKVHGWPNNPHANGWRSEQVRCQAEAETRFGPSMRQRIHLGRLYADALEQLEPLRHEPVAPLPWPADCPFTLEQLLHDKQAALDECLRAASGGATD